MQEYFPATTGTDVEAERVLETLIRVGTAVSAELDTRKIVQTVTDAGTELSGAKFGAFFFNAVNEQGESLLLYTLSGAPREAFERFGIPRSTPVFAPTFTGDAAVRAGLPEEGVAVAARVRPGVVILDLLMPKLDGHDACRHIREQGWGKGTALIALTGLGQDEDRRRTADAGFDAHMVKPVDPSALLKLLASLSPEDREIEHRD